MKFTFHKMQSLGNDFVLIDTSQFTGQISFNQEFYKAVCDRTLGIGCDLVVLYYFEDKDTVHALFFNADGSEAEICGNAARCIGLLMKKLKNISNCIMKTHKKIFNIQIVNDENISILCEKPSFKNSDIGLSNEIKNARNFTEQADLQKIVNGIDVYHISAISVGNPHVVLLVKNMPSIEQIKNIGSQIETNHLFKNRVNVCFVRVLSDSKIELFVFERGCGLTLACGSGACAAAISAYNNNFINCRSIIVQQRGGNLQIDVHENNSYSHIGFAAYVFYGISENLLKEDMFSIIENNTCAKSCKTGQVIIYTDGACSGNPGPGGWGVLIIYSNEEKKELSGYEENTTNNRMELMAAIMALESLDQSSNVKLFTDSKYVKDGITNWISKWIENEWKTSEKKPVKNKELWIKLLNLSHKHRIAWHWVKGHAENEFNARADFLARSSYEDKKKIIN